MEEPLSLDSIFRKPEGIVDWMGSPVTNIADFLAKAPRFRVEPNEEETARISLVETRLASIEEEIDALPLGTGTRAEIQNAITALEKERDDLELTMETIRDGVIERQDAEKKQYEAQQRELALRERSDWNKYGETLRIDFERWKGEPATAEEEMAIATMTRQMLEGKSWKPDILKPRAGALREWADRTLPGYTGIQRTGDGVWRTWFDPNQPEAVPSMERPVREPAPEPPDPRQIAGQIIETKQVLDELIKAEAPQQTIRMIRNQLTSLQIQLPETAPPWGRTIDMAGATLGAFEKGGRDIARNHLAFLYESAFTGQSADVQEEQIERFLNIAIPTIGEDTDELSPLQELSVLYAMFDSTNAPDGIKDIVDGMVRNQEFGMTAFDIETQVSNEFASSYGIVSEMYPMTEPDVQTVYDNLISGLKKAGALPAVLTESQRRYLMNEAQRIVQQARIDGIDEEGLDLGAWILAASDSTSQATSNIIQQGGLESVVQEELAKEYLATQPLNIQFETMTGTQLKTGKETRTEQDMANEQAFQMFQSQIQQARLRGLDPDIAQIAQQSMGQVSDQMKRFRGEDLPQVTDEQREGIAAGQGGYQPVPSQALTGPIGGMFANLWNQYEKNKDARIRQFIDEEQERTGEDISYADAEEALFPDPVAPEPSRFDKEEAAVKERGRQDAIDEYIRINTPDRIVTEEEARAGLGERPQEPVDPITGMKYSDPGVNLEELDPSAVIDYEKYLEGEQGAMSKVAVAPTEAEAEKALSGMNIFKEDYTMPGFGEPEPDIVPTTPPPPGLAGTTRRRRRAIT